MKKILAVLCLMLTFSMGLAGCSFGKESYTQEEQKAIDLANKVITEKYNVTIDKDLYKYNVGKEVAPKKFEKIAEGETPEIISVSALSKDLPKEGEILDYALTYNTKTNTILTSEMNLYQGGTEAK